MGKPGTAATITAMPPSAARLLALCSALAVAGCSDGEGADTGGSSGPYPVPPTSTEPSGAQSDAGPGVTSGAQSGDSGPATTAGSDGPGAGTSGTTDEAASGGTLDSEGHESGPDLLCTPGERRCVGSVVVQCSGDGLVEVEVVQCSSSQVCRASEMACVDVICVPREPGCVGQVATICNADGTAYEEGGSDCWAQGRSCSGGVCVARACDPSTHLCVDGHVHRCAADGLASSLHDLCGDDEFCEPGRDSCRGRVCEPGSSFCVGQVASVCADDGSGARPGGTDCDAKEPPLFCVDGNCVSDLCRPDALFCRDGDVHLCGSDGRSSVLRDECDAAQECVDMQPECRDLACEPEVAMCDLSGKATVCKLDGSGPEPDGEDCPAMGQHCEFGRCTAAWLEDFEDGNLDAWEMTAPARAMTSVVAEASADGTGLGLPIDTPSAQGSQHFVGPRKRFTVDGRPRIARWRARVHERAALGYVVLFDEDERQLCYMQFAESGQIEVSRGAPGSGTHQVKAFQVGRWYAFELAFDWSSSAFHLAIDGALVLANEPMRDIGAAGIRELSLYNFDPGMSDFDDFVWSD